MRYFIILTVIVSAGLIIYGFNLEESQQHSADKFIGAGTMILFFIAMPLFLYSESKGKKFKDYMLTEESIRKMQGKEPKEPKDS